MINVQDFIENGQLFKKFKVDELLFTEINCPVEDDDSGSGLWWHHNFFAYALAGEMALKTLRGEYIFKAGDCIFAKKGSLISATHHIQEDFCELRVFVPDDFIRAVFLKYKISPVEPKSEEKSDTLIPLASDDLLEAWFHSLLPYFNRSAPPPKALLKLKFEELLMDILSTNKHRPLKCYFDELCRSGRCSIQEIMEANFMKNLTLREFSRLCGRSLTAFKVEFESIYHTSPGRWLRERRLEYSRYLLETTQSHIDEICYMSGFENSSHFIRVFKDKYGLPPGKFKTQRFLQRQQKQS